MKLPRKHSLLGSSASDGETRSLVVSHHEDYTVGETTGGLSVVFTTLCIVDLFGVFPVVALPKSVISCGVYGVPLVLAVFGLQLYTAVLLGRSWLLAQDIAPDIQLKNRFPYAAVAELAFGRRVRRLVTFLLDATVFGAGVPNFIFASQSLQLFWWKITGGGVGVSYCVWMVVLGLMLCPVMWLGSPKHMKPLAVASVLIVSTVAICTWTCILLDDVSPPSVGLVNQPGIRDLVVAYGIIAFQFDIHPMLLTLQVDMKDGRLIHRAAACGFLATGVLFAITAALAANRYGEQVDNNILQGIPPSIALYVVALLVTLQLCLSSAVGNSALFQHIEDFLKIPRDFCLQRCLVRSGIVALAVFLGESVPRFDVVMGLVGSTLTGPLMFIFPPLFFLRLCYMKTSTAKDNLKMENLKNLKNGDSKPNFQIQNGGTYLKFSDAITNAFSYQTFTNSNTEREGYNVRWYDVVLAGFVMLMGVAATIVATYSSWAETITSSTFTPPCLVNATAAARSFLLSSRPPV